MQGKLADMYTTFSACRAYVYAVGQALDRNETTRKDAAGAILYAAEKATWMAGEAIQALGGMGYINETPTGRLWRDAKLYEIGAGTSEIRRWLIGRELSRKRNEAANGAGAKARPAPADHPGADGRRTVEPEARRRLLGGRRARLFRLRLYGGERKGVGWEKRRPRSGGAALPRQPVRLAASRTRSPPAQRPALDAVARYYAELGTARPSPCSRLCAGFPRAARCGRAHPAEGLHLHLAALPPERLRNLQRSGSSSGGAPRTVAEAAALESLGVDFIIAQGGEAGGTAARGCATPTTRSPARSRSRADRARGACPWRPGGIMDGAGIAAVLALGAQAAQLGTAFIPCPERGVGRCTSCAARGAKTIRASPRNSPASRRGASSTGSRPKWRTPAARLPAQNSITGKLRAASAKAGKPDLRRAVGRTGAPLCARCRPPS